MLELIIFVLIVIGVAKAASSITTPTKYKSSHRKYTKKEFPDRDWR